MPESNVFANENNEFHISSAPKHVSILAITGTDLGYVIANRHGAVVAYVHWPKPEGVEWPESWDTARPEDAPHVICRLVPVEE